MLPRKMGTNRGKSGPTAGREPRSPSSTDRRMLIAGELRGRLGGDWLGGSTRLCYSWLK